MRVPEEVSACSRSGWEDAYFASEFTHPSGAVHLTTHPGGFLELWSNLAGRGRRFPVKFLADAQRKRCRSLCRNAGNHEAMEAHHIHPELLKHKVRVLVVGCGGNGVR